MLFRLQKLLILFIFISNELVYSANILAVTTVLSPSHYLFHDVYLLELVKRGHNVTLLGHDDNKHHHPNYTHVVMEGAYNKLKNHFDSMEMTEMSEWQLVKALWSFSEITCLLDYQTQGLQKIKSYPDNFFDLIIWDINVGQCLYPLIEKFGRPPVVAVTPFINQPNVFRNIWQSYIPFITHAIKGELTLLQRIKNVFYNAIFEVSRHIHYIPRQQELAEKYFGKINMTISKIERNMSLMLANYNPVFNYVEALPPNIIPIGGLHIQPKPLPEDLNKILDNSKSGAILFSLGSNVRAKELGDEKIQAIIKTFAKLKQTIIWKFENDKLDGLPKNVHILKWVPQNDILGHPNTILFITHGGLLSSHEIIYNGVPAIGIPFFLDQLQNVELFISKGIGERINFYDITENSFYRVIQKVLNNATYRENAKKLSTLYQHQMNKPLDVAIFWIEYILKYKSASHLDLATRDMNFFESSNLDLFLICLLSLTLLSAAIFCLTSFISKCVVKENKTKQE